MLSLSPRPLFVSSPVSTSFSRPLRSLTSETPPCFRFPRGPSSRSLCPRLFPLFPLSTPTPCRFFTRSLLPSSFSGLPFCRSLSSLSPLFYLSRSAPVRPSLRRFSSWLLLFVSGLPLFYPLLYPRFLYLSSPVRLLRLGPLPRCLLRAYRPNYSVRRKGEGSSPTTINTEVGGPVLLQSYRLLYGRGSSSRPPPPHFPPTRPRPRSSSRLDRPVVYPGDGTKDVRREGRSGPPHHPPPCG